MSVLVVSASGLLILAIMGHQFGLGLLTVLSVLFAQSFKREMW